MQRPVVVLAAGLALAVAGWAADARAPVLSDLRELVPRDLRALRDLDTLQRTTGVAGEVDVVVEGRDLTDPKVVAWMRDYQTELLGRFGYSAENGCGRAALCPALSLPDLFRTQRASADRRRIRALLDAVPPYFSQAVITRDRRTANLGFGIRLMSLERQQAVIEVMRERLRPPPGVRARVGGLPVLAAEANAALSSPLRRLLTVLAGLLAVGLALLAAYRRWERAWVPLVPVVLATGWSGLVLFALGVPLNPLSAALGALVIAIATEFSVLLCARFWAEARTGTVEAALRRTYRSTGTAVLASGTTVLAGFAVLAFSDVRMLRDFGIVTVVGLAVSLLGVIAVLPSVIVLAARRGGTTPARGAARPGAAPSRRRDRAGGGGAVNEAPRAGAVEPALAAEFPGLGVLAVTVPGSPVRSSEGVRERLRRLSDGFRGADAVALRSRPVPQAYRGFFRGVGLDPDAERTPVEALVLERMLTGAWAPRDAVSDAVRIAIVETGVAVLALDTDTVAGVPGVRQAAAGEPLDGAPLPAGRLVLADARVAVAAHFRPGGRGVRGASRDDLGVARRRRGARGAGAVRRGGAVGCGRGGGVVRPVSPYDDDRDATPTTGTGDGVLLLAVLPTAASAGHHDVPLRADHDHARAEHDRVRAQRAQAARCPATSRASSRTSPTPTAAIPRVDVIHLHHGVWIINGRPHVRRRRGEDDRPAFPQGYGWRHDPERPLAHEPHDPQPARRAGRGLHHLRASTSSPTPRPRRRDHARCSTLWMDVAGIKAYPVFDALRGQGERDGRFTFPDDGARRSAGLGGATAGSSHQDDDARRRPPATCTRAASTPT